MDLRKKQVKQALESGICSSITCTDTGHSIPKSDWIRKNDFDFEYRFIDCRIVEYRDKKKKPQKITLESFFSEN